MGMGEFRGWKRGRRGDEHVQRGVGIFAGLLVFVEKLEAGQI